MESKNRGAESRNPVSYVFGKMFHYSAGNKRKIVVFWFMFVVAEFSNLFFRPFVWAKMMNVIQDRGITPESIKTLFGLLLLTLACELWFWIFHTPGRLMEEVNAFGARLNYRRHLLKGVMTLPMEWHVEHHSGDTIDKTNKGTGALFEVSRSSFRFVYDVVKLIGSYAVLAYFSYPASYIVLAMIIISGWITTRFDRVLIGQYQKLNYAENRISESIFDAVSNIATVIILRVEGLVFNAIMRKSEEPFDLFKRSNRLNEVKWFLTALCCAVMTVAVLGVYFWQNMGAGQSTLIGNVYLLINYLSNISELFFNFTDRYGEIVNQKSKIMNSEELSRDFGSESFTNHVLPADWRRLEIENLNFSYHGGDDADLHLEKVSLSLRRGEHVALVGESGSGKSTLLKVMRDLYCPQEIKLTVDGRTIPQGFGGISRAMALVPQDPEIFATTILENITLGAEYDLDFVRRFTDMACFTGVAESLPRKFDSSIKEKGVNLSGGQQQRLALARGLLACHDKDIALLDEPTSSLDTITEMTVYRNILRGFADKTIISTVHRLHLLPMFNRIYLFEDGRVIAFGTLNELIAACPKFKEMWSQYY